MPDTVFEAASSAQRPLAGVPGDPFDALGDPNRRTIVEPFGRGSRSVQELPTSCRSAVPPYRATCGC